MIEQKSSKLNVLWRYRILIASVYLSASQFSEQILDTNDDFDLH